MFAATIDWHSLPWTGIVAGVTAAALIVFTALIWIRQEPDETEDDPSARILNRDAPARAPGTVAQPKARDRRTAARRDGRPVPVQIMEEDEVTEIGVGHMMDRSHTGICFVTHFPIVSGKKVNIRPHQTGGKHAYLLVEVKHCHHVGAVWEVGCKFVKQPPWSLMMDLG